MLISTLQYRKEKPASMPLYFDFFIRNQINLQNPTINELEMTNGLQ